MQHAKVNCDTVDELQFMSSTHNNKKALAKKWLADNQEAIEAYKAEQQKTGKTFSQMVGQI